MRGEHLLLAQAGHGQHGSSPRAWGAFRVTIARNNINRFIPTCVGAFQDGIGRLQAARFIPTCVEEHAPSPVAIMAPPGSSPRAWGAFQGVGAHAVEGRFIPTCVGSMFICVDSWLKSPVHPHVRGEHKTP